MSHYMSFSGTFCYADPMAMSRALAAFADQAGDGEIEPDDLQRDELSVTISIDGSGGASRWFASLEAVRALAKHAREGFVDARFEALEDENEHIRIHAGGREEEPSL